MMIETIIVEVIANLAFLAVTGILLFYYTPSDLFHVTSVQTLPFYYLFALIVLKSIKRFRDDWRYFSLMLLLIMVVVVYMA